MCGGSKPKAPPARDLEEERRQAEVEAAKKANTKTAADKRRRMSQSLLAMGMGGNAASGVTNSVMAQGKQTLGG